jgi:hypothetical protein
MVHNKREMLENLWRHGLIEEWGHSAWSMKLIMILLRAYVNKLKNQYLTADNGWSLGLVVVLRLNKHSVLNVLCYEMPVKGVQTSASSVRRTAGSSHYEDARCVHCHYRPIGSPRAECAARPTRRSAPSTNWAVCKTPTHQDMWETHPFHSHIRQLNACTGLKILSTVSPKLFLLFTI